MVCIVVEDGSIVTGANSYITNEEAEQLLNSIGETYGDITPSEIKMAILKATRYTEYYRDQYQGCKVSSAQELQFPRNNVYVDGFLISNDVIPKELKMAVATAALTLLNGDDLQIDNDGKLITQESIGGAISVTYSEYSGTGNELHYPLIETYLTPLFKSKSMVVHRK